MIDIFHKRVIESGKKALLILPFVALAREKMFHLQHVLGDTGIRVEGFMGSISPAGGIKVADIGVATIEKANGIVNRSDSLQDNFANFHPSCTMYICYFFRFNV